jgi:hypothetical protein
MIRTRIAHFKREQLFYLLQFTWIEIVVWRKEAKKLGEPNYGLNRLGDGSWIFHVPLISIVLIPTRFWLRRSATMTPLLDICPICGRELGYCPCAPLVLIAGDDAGKEEPGDDWDGEGEE